MTRFAARLMTRRARRAMDEAGVTMVIFSLLIVALLVVVAIVIDLGNARQQKRQLQNAADAAALAGAHDIGVTGGDPCAQAATYVYNNLTLGTPSNKTCTTTVPTGYTITITTPYTGGPAAFETDGGASLVNVKVCKAVGTSFARIIGITSVNVCGNATARKIGGSTGCTGSNCGTTTADPDAPCTVDAFTTNGYFDQSAPDHLQANPPGMKATSDNNHSGGAAGGPAAENAWMGATYSSTTDIDLTNNPPKFVLTNVTSGSTVVSNTYTSGNTGPVYIKRMTTVRGVDVSGSFVYDIAWKVPGGNVNNATYSISMSAYDSTSSSYAPNGKCGKAQWSFTKGHPPSSGGSSPCIPGASGQVEDSFLGTQFPAAGQVVGPGDTVGATFQDESPVYNGTDTPSHQIQFIIDKGTSNEIDLTEAPAGTTTSAGPNTLTPTSGTQFSLRSPTTLVHTSEKYSTDIYYTLPASMTNGLHTVYLIAYDTDSNKSGGDCGVGTWSFNLSGGAPSSSDVELVQ